MDKEFNFEKAQEMNAQKEATRISKWFSVSVSISVFGKVIWSYVWPPKSNNAL